MMTIMRIVVVPQIQISNNVERKLFLVRFIDKKFVILGGSFQNFGKTKKVKVNF